MNGDFSICPSYPPAVLVPKNVDDDTLRKVARFRQGGRFPVLCYHHRKNGMVRDPRPRWRRAARARLQTTPSPLFVFR